MNQQFEGQSAAVVRLHAVNGDVYHVHQSIGVVDGLSNTNEVFSDSSLNGPVVNHRVYVNYVCHDAGQSVAA